MAQRQIAANERIDVRMPDAPNVGAGNTAVFKLPTARRFHELQLVVSGTGVDLGDLEEIRVIANEKITHRYTGAERDSMNQFDGRTAWNLSTNPTLVIPFERYGMENSIAAQETALDTGPVVEGNGREIKALSLEIDLKSDAPGDLGLKLYATQSMSLGRGAGTVMHIDRSVRDAAGAGEYQFSDLPYGGVTSQALNRVFIKPSANDISLMKIDRDTYTIFERTKALNESIQKDGVRVPQSGYLVIDRTEKGFVGNRIDLRGVRDYRYKFTLTGAATLTFLSEYLGGLGD